MAYHRKMLLIATLPRARTRSSFCLAAWVSVLSATFVACADRERDGATDVGPLGAGGSVQGGSVGAVPGAAGAGGGLPAGFGGAGGRGGTSAASTSAGGSAGSASNAPAGNAGAAGGPPTGPADYACAGSPGASGAAGAADDTTFPGPATSIVPGSSGCALHSLIWQSDSLATVFLLCPAKVGLPVVRLSQTNDAGLTFSEPRQPMHVPSSPGFGVATTSFATLEDGSLVAAVPPRPGPAAEGGWTHDLWRGDSAGNDWQFLASTQTWRGPYGTPALATRGNVAFFTSPRAKNQTAPIETYGLTRAEGMTKEYVDIAQFDAPAGTEDDPTKPFTGAPLLVEPSGALWAVGPRALSRQAPNAALGAFGPVLVAPVAAAYVALNGAQVAWVSDAELRLVPSACPAFSTPISVPGLAKHGTWSGGGDEAGHIALVETPSDANEAIRLATIRPGAKSAADVHGFAAFPGAPVLAPLGNAGSAAVRTSVRAGRVMIATEGADGIVVYMLAPAF